MSNKHHPGISEFSVFNVIRCAVFVLVYVELFLLPFCFSSFVVRIVWFSLAMSSLALIAWCSDVYQTINAQVFDRIRLAKFGVEYRSGLFGDNWLRPYNEFRVDCHAVQLFVKTWYRVRVKHRVIPDLLIVATTNRQTAEQHLQQLTQNSRLRIDRSRRTP